MEGRVLALMEVHGDDSKTMCEDFVASSYGSRATFYRYFADVKERHKLQHVEYIRVKGKPPEAGPDPMANGADHHEEDAEDGDDENK